MKLKCLPLVALVFLAGCLPSTEFQVSVKVIDEQTGKPIPDAWVFVTAHVVAEPPFEAPYDKPLAGARARTDAQGIASLKDLKGLSFRGEPEDVLWKAIIGSREARDGKPPKPRIAGIKDGSVVVMARGYGTWARPLVIKETPSNAKTWHYFGLVPPWLSGADEPIEVGLKDIAQGKEVVFKMSKPEKLGYLEASFCPSTVMTTSWAASSEKTGTSEAEKRKILKFIQQGVVDLGMKALDSCGVSWFKPEFDKEFLDHEYKLEDGRDPALSLWMIEKALELLPPGYEEIKKHAEIIKGGAVAESADGRSANHFYNPYDSEWKMAKGEQALKWAEIGYPENPKNQWGWEDALRYYREGDKGKAYKALGHVLRALEDLSIPMNTHGIDYGARADSKESRFAVYFSTLVQANSGSLPPKFNWEARGPARISDVKTLFDTQAKLSFGKFGSDNLEINFDDYYGLGSVTRQPDDATLEAMGAYLFPKAIANGAGVMKMFYDGLHVQGYAQKTGESPKAATDAGGQGGVVGSTTAWTNLSPEERTRQRHESELAHWKSLLDEYHQGKRDENDGGAILFNVLHYYGVLGSSTTAEVAQLTKEWQDLLRKHPEFKIHPPHTHGEIEATATRQKLSQEMAKKRANWTANDNVIDLLFRSGNKVAVQYQYRLEFYELSDGLELNRSGGKLHLTRSGQEIPLKELTPRKVVQFVHPINRFGQPIHRLGKLTGRDKTLIAVCTDLVGSYYAKSEEEELVIGWGKAKWLNPKGQLDAFCGMFDLDGNIIFQLPMRPHIPEAMIQVSPLNDDDIAVFEIHPLVGEEGERGFGAATRILIWERPSVLHAYDLAPDKFGRTNIEQDKVLRKYGLSVN